MNDRIELIKFFKICKRLSMTYHLDGGLLYIRKSQSFSFVWKTTNVSPTT